MNTETRSRRGRWKIAACVLLAAVALVAAGFFWYVSDYYRRTRSPWRCWPGTAASRCRTI